MKTWSLVHLADHELLRDLTALAARDRLNTAELLAHIAEVDERKLYVPAAYGCMRDWCVGELRMSEDAAFKRIRVARTAREYPEIFTALADGGLNMTLVMELRPYLRTENAAELLASAVNKSKNELKDLLAARFPKSDKLELMQGSTSAGGDAASAEIAFSLAPEPVNHSHAAGEPTLPAATVRFSPLSASSFALTATVSRATHDKLECAKDLLSHAVPSGDLGAVLDRALDALIAKLEQKKFGVTSRARSGGRKSLSPRYIPMSVRRAIHQRDRGCCTFVSESGKRCESTTRLEIDHETPVAQGGQATVANLRLRCRTHNQYAAEQAFGRDFMRGKREQSNARKGAQHGAAAEPEVRPKGRGRELAAASDHDADDGPGHDVLPYLRALGIRGDDAREAAARSNAIHDATLEERVKFALASRAGRFMRRPVEGGPQAGIES